VTTQDGGAGVLPIHGPDTQLTCSARRPWRCRGCRVPAQGPGRDVEEFVEALSRVAAGGTLSTEVVTQLLGQPPRQRSAHSRRESEVLELMAEGRSNAAIAGIWWCLSGPSKARRDIFSKLGLARRTPTPPVLAVLRYLES